MVKSVFVEIVYNRIYGGRPTTDWSVLKSDIEAFIPAAVNFALTKGFYNQKNTEGNGDLPTNFYQTYPDLEIEVDGKNNKFVEMPATLISMPSNRGLRTITDDCGHVFTPVADNHISNLTYWLNILISEKFYRLRGKNLYLYNVNPLASKVNVDMIISADELGPNDELPIPAGLEEEALNICYEFAMGTRQIPNDTKIDTQDIK